MPLLRKRDWCLPDGSIWTSWVVEWIGPDNRQKRRVFDSFREASRYHVGLAQVIRSRKRLSPQQGGSHGSAR